MKKIYFSTLFLFVIGLTASAQVSHLVISQVYGGGGNASATYNRDFVELFNPTGSSISLSGYSIQYASATGSSWASKTLSGSVAANSYFLIQMTTSGSIGAALPTPDIIVTPVSDMGGTAGKVALVNVTTALTGTCPTGAMIVDFVGYGTTANCFEGTGPTPAPSNANSVFRGSGGCMDTDNNAGDFTVGTANARNSTSPTNACAAANTISAGTVATPPFCVNASSGAAGTIDYSASGTYNTTFTAYLSDAAGSFASPVNIGLAAVNGTNPAGSISITIPAGTASGTGYKIRVDATSPAVTGFGSSSFEIVDGVKNVTGLNASQGQTNAVVSWTNPTSCFNDVLVVAKQGASITGAPTGDGTAYSADANFAGSGTAFDGGKVVYMGPGTSVNVTGLTTAGDYYFKVFARNGTTWSSGVEYHIPSLGVLNHLVISQVYGGGGNASAVFTNDFVELFNPTNAAISLTGYSLQYTSATGNNWSTTKLDLVGTVAAYSYFLVQLGSNSATGAALPTPDQAGSFNMSATVGKITLVNSTVALTANCPASGSYVDFVGYGTTADCSEGTNAPAPSNTIGLQRGSGGCTDTDNNSTDFTATAPAPRNSASPINNCSTGAGPLPVHFSAFKATERSNGIQLSWTNETEENLVVYLIERSPDGRNYTSIGEVKAMKNDNSKASYGWLDVNPVNGYNYYRINAVEQGGKQVYSSVLRINTASTGTEFVIYPNPVKDELHLQISSLKKGAYTIKVYNTGGQELVSQTISHPGGAITETILLNKLKPGLYSVLISGITQLKKQFIIE